jgi:hypothetical protein
MAKREALPQGTRAMKEVSETTLQRHIGRLDSHDSGQGSRQRFRNFKWEETERLNEVPCSEVLALSAKRADKARTVTITRTNLLNLNPRRTLLNCF